MTVLFLLFLALLALLMKLAALWRPGGWAVVERAFLFTPVLSPESLRRSRPLSATPGLVLRTVPVLGALWFVYGVLAPHMLRLPAILVGYLAVPALLLVSELGFAIVALLWLPCGRLLPPLHHQPLLARGVADFWGRRWNLWFSEWFRHTLFVPRRRRPGLAVFWVFFVSGLMHEWVLNLPLWLVTGRRRFGTMMLYFLLQAGGVMIEHRFLRGHPGAKRLFAWLVVFVPAPLILGEGLLRTLHLWPE